MERAPAPLGTPLRRAHVEIDLPSLAGNLTRLRNDAGVGRRIFAVVKGDAYGAGLVPCSKALERAGVDALAVGNADDAVTLRAAGIGCDILVYGSTPPERAPELAGIDAILTIHDVASMQAIQSAACQRDGPVRVMVKVDCGLARLGVAMRDLEQVFASLAEAGAIAVEGIYTHLAGQQSPERVAEQGAKLALACEIAASHGVSPALRMLASSRVILEHPALNLTAIDPGRLVFGLARHDWDVGHDYAPVIARFTARIVQVSDVPKGTIPYGSDRPVERDLRVAVVAAGTADGLVFTQPGQPVLVRGSRARQLGGPGIEHSMLDLSDVPMARVGDEVTYFGRDGADEITPLDFARLCGRPIDQVIPLVGRLARRTYRAN